MGRSYIIKHGDTMDSIAKATGVSADDIALENGVSSAMSVDPNMLREGNTIFIPDIISGKGKENTGGADVTGGSDTGSGAKVPEIKEPEASNASGAKVPETPAVTGGTKYQYTPSSVVLQAEQVLNERMNQKPAAYTSKWETELRNMLYKIQNREDFSYDMNADALYQQYKDQYVQQGKMAMQDAMGQAAAMTGGYGNSYAATAGNQAYQAQLNNLNDVIPELYEMAYNRHVQEGNDMYNQYAMLMDRENADYNRHLDEYNMWAKDIDRLASQYWNTLETDMANQQAAYKFKQEAEDRAINMALNGVTVDENGKVTVEKGETGESGISLEHVATMSSQDLVDAMQSYSDVGDDRALAAFLDDCVLTGRMTEEQALEYYEKYKSKESEEEGQSTDVPRTSGSAVSGTYLN